MKPFFCLAIFAAVSYAQVPLDQKTNKELQVHERGRVAVRGSDEMTFVGMLFDAACKDRTGVNLATAPESISGTIPAEYSNGSKSAPANNSGGISASGVNVDAKTLATERADILQHQVPDLRTRQQDPTCAITGSTSTFGLALSDGRLLNLDQAGNTLAGDSVLQTAQGRAMLNGQAYGYKPRVQVSGRIRGDRFFVEHFSVMQ